MQTANMIVDMMNAEAMMNVRVAYGTIVQEQMRRKLQTLQK